MTVAEHFRCPISGTWLQSQLPGAPGWADPPDLPRLETKDFPSARKQPLLNSESKNVYQ